MSTFTVWNGAIPVGGGTPSSTATGSRTDSLVFQVSSPCTLSGIAFWVPSTETNLAGSNYNGILYTTVTGTTGTLVAQNAGSGTFVAGQFNWVPFNVALTPGVFYSGCINHPDLLEFISGFWGTAVAASGFTSGPLSAPAQASAPGTIQQGFFNAGLGFPGSANHPATWYGIDVRVETALAANAMLEMFP